MVAIETSQQLGLVVKSKEYSFIDCYSQPLKQAVQSCRVIRQPLKINGDLFLRPLGTVSNKEVDCSVLQLQKGAEELFTLDKREYRLFCSLKEDRGINKMFSFETTGLMMKRSVAFVENMAIFKVVLGKAKDKYPGKYYFQYAVI